MGCKGGLGVQLVGVGISIMAPGCGKREFLGAFLGSLGRSGRCVKRIVVISGKSDSNDLSCLGGGDFRFPLMLVRGGRGIKFSPTIGRKVEGTGGGLMFSVGGSARVGGNSVGSLISLVASDSSVFSIRTGVLRCGGGGLVSSINSRCGLLT